MAKIKRITSREASKIIETRKPLGLFYLQEDKNFVAIDNTAGDAWTEEFKAKEDCVEWLMGEAEPDTIYKKARNKN